MPFIAALTKQQYQYRLSIPKKLIEVLKWEREKIVSMSVDDKGSLVINKFRKEGNGNNKS
jgi:bifunctional DNA-binding transcriptional regulator/antitoxin component of YhaV-PrlF toxin-antitoxin module